MSTHSVLVTTNPIFAPGHTITAPAPSSHLIIPSSVAIPPVGVPHNSISSFPPVSLPTHAVSVAPPQHASSSIFSVENDASGIAKLSGVMTIATSSRTDRAPPATLETLAGEDDLPVQSGMSSLGILTVNVQDAERPATTLITAPVTPNIAAASTVLTSIAVNSAPPLSTSGSGSTPTLAVEVMAMQTAAPPITNIFNPDNRLLPLGISAVALAALFLSILSVIIFLRYRRYTKNRRFDKREPIPSFVKVRDRSSSFHDRSIYLDQAESGSANNTFREDTKTQAMISRALQREYQQQSYGSTASLIGNGQPVVTRTEHNRSGSHGGIASTTLPLAEPRFAHGRGPSLASEKVFFPGYFPQLTRTLTPPKIGISSSSAGSARSMQDAAINSPATSFSAVRPAFGNGRPVRNIRGLVLANPDLSRQGTPQLPSPNTRQETLAPPRPVIRDSISTFSSFGSRGSTPSMYSQLSRAVSFKLRPPVPAFAITTRAGAGTLPWARERIEPLDVPKDAVSRPVSDASAQK